MTTAQINARIDANTKLAGDQALSSVGFTPTQAVRALWEFAERNRYNHRKLKDTMEGLLEKPATPDIDDEALTRMKQVEEGPLIIRRALIEMGVDPDNCTPPDFTDKELLEEALAEAMREKGLL